VDYADALRAFALPAEDCDWGAVAKAFFERIKLLERRLDNERAAYSEVLMGIAETIDPFDEDYGYLRGAAGEAVTRIVDKMIAGFKRGTVDNTRHDWLGRNKALKTACRSLGINTSPEFREMVKQWSNEV
jgi:hypothetical protein